MIYLYGLIEAAPNDVATALQHCHGLQGHLQQAQVGDWVLVFSDHDDQEVLPKRRLLLAHTQVLEQMLILGTVLPARFGLVAKDAATVATTLSTNANDISQAFDKVRGAVELGVRMSYPRQAVLEATLEENAALRTEHAKLRQAGPDAHFAIAEFGGRLAEEVDRRRGKAQRDIITKLRRHARDFVLRTPEEDTEVLRAEFLIEETVQDAFQSSILDASATLDFAPGQEPKIEIIGPVPMYNFVQLSLIIDPDQAAA